MLFAVILLRNACCIHMYRFYKSLFHCSKITSLTDGLVYFEDLLEESVLQSSLRILEKDYEDAIHIRGELDERMFIDENDSILGTGSLSGGAINMCSRKVCYS